MILVTGGLGYVGGRVAAHFSELGYEVRVGTRTPDRFDPVIAPRMQVVPIDLSDRRSLDVACNGITSVIHLAALDAPSCEINPASGVSVNGNGTRNLLDSALKQNVERFIYMSTVHVYGSPLAGSLSEESAPLPIHPYAVSKYLGEKHIVDAHLNGRLKTVVFRLSNVVGCPRWNNPNATYWNLLVNELCRQVVRQRRMTVRSNANTKRDFIPVSSVLSAIDSSIRCSRMSGKTFNLSSGVTCTLKEVTKIIAARSQEVFGYQPEILFEDSDKKAVNPPFRIANERLKNIGISINSQLNDEIDKLLNNIRDFGLPRLADPEQ